MTRPNELVCWLALAYRSGLTMRQVKNILIPWCLAQGRPLAELLEQPASFWRDHLGLSDAEVGGLQRTRSRLSEGAELLAQLADQGVQMATFAGPGYPQALTEALDPLHRPALLFLQGNLDLLAEPGVAILGGDDASVVVADFARQVARLLAADDVNIVLQPGNPVGDAALAGALEAEGVATVVVPQGLLSFQPGPELAARLERGRVLLLSPVEPSQGYDSGLAGPCLRVTAGLARQLLVVAARRGEPVWGAIQEALTLGRMVYMAPGAPATDREALAAAGAVVVADPGAAAEKVIRRLVEEVASVGLADTLAGPVPAAPAEAIPEEESAPLEPEALIKLLERSGRVPEQLKRRLKPDAS